MKRISYFLFVLLTPMAMVAQHSIFHKYASQPDVKYVSISHTMLEAMSSEKHVKVGSLDLSSMVDMIDNILIIRASEPSGMTAVLGDLQQLQQNDAYEPLLERNMKGQRSISLFKESDGKSEFVLFSLMDTYTIIVITGTFTPKQFQSYFL